jgi:hypothetical protein
VEVDQSGISGMVITLSKGKHLGNSNSNQMQFVNSNFGNSMEGYIVICTTK